MADYDLRQVALLVVGGVVAWEGFYMLFKVVVMDGASWWLSGFPGMIVGTVMLVVGSLIAYGTYVEIAGKEIPEEDVPDPDWSVPDDGRERADDREGRRVSDPTAADEPGGAETSGAGTDVQPVTDTTTREDPRTAERRSERPAADRDDGSTEDGQRESGRRVSRDRERAREQGRPEDEEGADDRDPVRDRGDDETGEDR